MSDEPKDYDQDDPNDLIDAEMERVSERITRAGGYGTESPTNRALIREIARLRVEVNMIRKKMKKVRKPMEVTL